MASIPLSELQRDRLVGILVQRVGLLNRLDRENFLHRADLLAACRPKLAWDAEPEEAAATELTASVIGAMGPWDRPAPCPAAAGRPRRRRRRAAVGCS